LWAQPVEPARPCRVSMMRRTVITLYLPLFAREDVSGRPCRPRRRRPGDGEQGCCCNQECEKSRIRVIVLHVPHAECAQGLLLRPWPLGQGRFDWPVWFVGRAGCSTSCVMGKQRNPSRVSPKSSPGPVVSAHQWPSRSGIARLPDDPAPAPAADHVRPSGERSNQKPVLRRSPQ
jgi:hypothetical protein